MVLLLVFLRNSREGSGMPSFVSYHMKSPVVCRSSSGGNHSFSTLMWLYVMVNIIHKSVSWLLVYVAFFLCHGFGLRFMARGFSIC